MDYTSKTAAKKANCQQKCQQSASAGTIVPQFAPILCEGGHYSLTGILIEPTGARAYVAVSSENGVTVIDLKTMEAADHIETGPGPDGLGWAVKE
jgi:YVTN family beta-propeller protein